MPHIHWVPRQNKLEIPKNKDEVTKLDIHDCDGRAHDPDTMVAPLTPKPNLSEVKREHEKKKLFFSQMDHPTGSYV